MMSFAPTPGWLDWERNRTQSKTVLPEGSIDAHCHVFGPGEVFPFAPTRKYTPCDASKADLFRLHQDLGIARRVVVQATCHGTDNAALIDVLASDSPSTRGVISVSSDITEEELSGMHEQGVRGVRFNFVKRLVEHSPYDELSLIAEKIKALGWHIVIYFEAADLPDLEGFLAGLPVPLVIDHMGRPDVSASAADAEFSRFISFVDRTSAWVKVSCPERLSQSGPFAVAGNTRIYEDVVPFARRVISEFPDHVLWGTDWPHPNLKTHMPDDAVLLNYLTEITESDAQLRRLLVDNPNALYWA